MSGENHVIFQAAWGTFLYIVKTAIKNKHTIIQTHFLTPCKNKHFLPSGLKRQLFWLVTYEVLKESVRQKYVWQRRQEERHRNHGYISASWATQQINEEQNVESVVSRESKFESTILRLLKLIYSVIHLNKKYPKVTLRTFASVKKECGWIPTDKVTIP